MKGIILNEGEYVTYPKVIFDIIPELVKSLNWRISNVACMGGNDFVFPFEDTIEEYWIDGESLYDLIYKHPDIQWIWGLLSGFSKDILKKDICDNKYIDITREGIPSYWNKPISPLYTLVTIEIYAFDSSATYVMCRDDDIYSLFREKFVNSVDLETQIDMWENAD